MEQLMAMKVPELRSWAKQRGVSGYSKLRKHELATLLVGAQSNHPKSIAPVHPASHKLVGLHSSPSKLGFPGLRLFGPGLLLWPRCSQHAQGFLIDA